MEDTFEKFVEEFIAQVIGEMDFSDITDEEKDQLRSLVRIRVDKNIMGLIVENLTEEQYKELSVKLEEKEWTDDEQQEIFAEAAHKIPEFEEELAEMFSKLKTELLEDAEQLKNMRE
ncbi:MAG: hypothetical protein ABH856_00475 [Patescibacteria group bacterium]|nr:hypothetical protein [Patescibacteria group bacterium]